MTHPLWIAYPDETFKLLILKCSREIDLKSGAVSAEQLSEFTEGAHACIAALICYPSVKMVLKTLW